MMTISPPGQSRSALRARPAYTPDASTGKPNCELFGSSREPFPTTPPARDIDSGPAFAPKPVDANLRLGGGLLRTRKRALCRHVCASGILNFNATTNGTPNGLGCEVASCASARQRGDGALI